jgi:hypothetical protein
MEPRSQPVELSVEPMADLRDWHLVCGVTWADFPYDEGNEESPMTELHAGYTNEQISEIGRKIYEERIRKLVEPDRIGHYVVIDIGTGDYEVDQDHLAAGLRLIDRRPNGARYGIKIGHRTAGRIGFAPFRPAL